MDWELHTLAEFRAVFKLLEENNLFNQPIPKPLFEAIVGTIGDRKAAHPPPEAEVVTSEQK